MTYLHIFRFLNFRQYYFCYSCHLLYDLSNKNFFLEFVDILGSDQTAHWHSLFRAFAVHTMLLWAQGFPQKEYWCFLICRTDVQEDRYLHWLLNLEDGFSRVAAWVFWYKCTKPLLNWDEKIEIYQRAVRRKPFGGIEGGLPVQPSRWTCLPKNH